MVLYLLSMMGRDFRLGLTRSACAGLSNWMYSSKSNSIFKPVRGICSIESFGIAFTRTGGRESLGPPVGGAMRAHPCEHITATSNTKTAIRDIGRKPKG